ncbi:hydroxymethylglutaryl-CoA lyase [bacterium]|nr:hydroxymethylglutaryl-CoA lyase [bacterium]
MSISITECPRDAMQGLENWIPTEVKADYINQLLKVGFDVIDFGSFVSPKAIPQLKDTAEVLSRLELNDTRSKLLAIVANERGAKDASQFNEIAFQGYPFSISPTFQKRNTNSTIEESLKRVESINEIAQKSNQELLIYISMAFGNPYGDEWSPDLASSWIETLIDRFGIKHFALADTVGVSAVRSIQDMFETVMQSFEDVQIGAHLHSNPESTVEKVIAAYSAGCRSFDCAIGGLGGCPMAEDDLVGNVDTIQLINGLPKVELKHINLHEFELAVSQSKNVFN